MATTVSSARPRGRTTTTRSPTRFFSKGQRPIGERHEMSPWSRIDLVFADDAVGGEGAVLVLDVDIGAKVNDRSRPRLGLDHGERSRAV